MRRTRSPVTDPTDRHSGADPAIDTLAFDDALAAFQRTVAELETGGLPLERAIALFERGTALHEHLAKLLTQAELKVQQLVTRAGGALETIDVAPDTARDSE